MNGNLPLINYKKAEVNSIHMDKRIAILLVIIGILLIAIGYTIFQQNDAGDANNTALNNTVNNTTVKNATLDESSQKTVSGKYGYCAVCGKALTYEEAHNEYTQGKVCHACANNPYYQTGEGAAYANQKLEEAYPDEYNGISEDSYEQNYNDNEYEDDEDY